MDWLETLPPESAISIATTRINGLKNISTWLFELNHGVKEIWVAIGPEGGWTAKEYSRFVSNKNF